MSSVNLGEKTRMPRKVKPASILRRQARTPSARGRTGSPIPLEQRQAILDDAKALILQGRTIDQIAAKHGIAHSTLELWLSAMGEEYQELRQAWLDGMLIESGTMLKEAQDALGLARARELFRRAQWYAERRDPSRYGDTRNLQVNVAITDLGDRLRRAKERVIDVAPVQQTAIAAPLQDDCKDRQDVTT